MAAKEDTTANRLWDLVSAVNCQIHSPQNTFAILTMQGPSQFRPPETIHWNNCHSYCHSSRRLHQNPWCERGGSASRLKQC